MKDFKFIGDGLKARDSSKSYNPSFNVLNILRSLIEDQCSSVYIPYNYKNGTIGNYDPKVHYFPYEAGRPVKITGIQSNKERFNFSLTGIIDVAVEVEKEDGTVDIQMKKVFRQYNVIRDGKLVIDKLVAKLSEQSFIALRDSDILYYNGFKVMRNHGYNPEFLYKIVLTDVPLVSLNWSRPINLGLYKYMIEEINISNELSLIKKVIRRYKDLGQELKGYNNEFYTESNSEQSEDQQIDKVLVECVVYEFKNLSNDKDIVRLTEEDICNRYTDIQSAENARKVLNSRLINIRFIIRCIIMAIEFSRKGYYNWSEAAKIPRTKDKYEQTCDVELEGRILTLRRVSYSKLV